MFKRLRKNFKPKATEDDGHLGLDYQPTLEVILPTMLHAMRRTPLFSCHEEVLYLDLRGSGVKSLPRKKLKRRMVDVPSSDDEIKEVTEDLARELENGA